MGKYDGKILMSDMDGTLLDSNSRVSERNKQAIRAFIKEGGRFGVATGRNLANAEAFLEGVDINGYCIFANGGLLYDPEKRGYVREYGMEKKGTSEFLSRCLKEQKGINIQIYARDMAHFISPVEYADTEVVRDHIPVCFDRMERMEDTAWLKILFSGSEEELQWLIRESASLEEEGIICRVRSAVNYYEFLPAGVSKGYMLERMRELVDDSCVIYAAGDYYNDIHMIRAADVGIAMGNAPEEVKACADRICAGCDADAIADIIEHIMA